jgi:hypothetical protein
MSTDYEAKARELEFKLSQPVRMAVANGALLEVPAFEQHHRGTNWLAIIDVDGTSPSGLSRQFINRGRGECFYLIEQVKLFDPIEFGADYTTSVGKRRQKRWYGVVTAKTDDFLIVEPCKTGAKAVILSKLKRVDSTALADAFAQEREVLLKRARELEDAETQLRSGAPPEDVLTSTEPVVVKEQS